MKYFPIFFCIFFATRVILDIIITSGNNNQYYTVSKKKKFFFATRVILDIIITSGNNNQYYTCSGRITTNLWMLLVNGWQKYWKISLVVMVITCENIGFITHGLRPLVINKIFSLVMTITTHNIFQYFLTAMYYYLNLHFLAAMFSRF